MSKVISWLEKYRDETGCRGVVLGISGGKDSTTVAMLAKKVWGNNIIGVMMPDGVQADLKDSIEVCETLGIDGRIVNIEQAVQVVADSLEIGSSEITPKAMTNIPPRVRMIVLYAIAQSIGYRVIGTGNASEAFIGWTTKWGDSAYDFNPICGLTCGEVVSLGLELAAELGMDTRLINKSPSDGLTGVNDEENFGFTYADLDIVVRGEQLSSPALMQKIMAMHEYTEHKRRMPHCFRWEDAHEN